MADEEEECQETGFESKNELGGLNNASVNSSNFKTGVKEPESSLNPVISSNEGEKQELKPDKHASFKVPSGNKDAKINERTDVQKKEKVPELHYKVPWWSAMPPQADNFHLEILKNGCIISTVDLKDKPFYVFGRLPLCDVVLEHPSISRYHALIQYRGETDGDQSLSGFYLYDLGSTHGTLVNKAKIKSKTYYGLKVGYVIKFGGSSRLFVLQGPIIDEGEEDETLPSPTTENTTVKAGQIFTNEEYESLKKVEEKSDQSEGIDWGFGEDAEEEQINAEKFEELYSGVEFKDPKKTLRGYYEREGLDLEYQIDETGPGHARVYHCRVRLPVDGPNGSAVYAEASVTGRKKEAVRECANEACKMLDAYGLLRQSTHESRKKREKNWEEEDFYESDEDNFLDRTGTVETKRLKRMRKAGKEKSVVDTYESLVEKMSKVQEEAKNLEKQISEAAAFNEANDEDSLDDFMNTISQRMDRGTKIKLKRKIIELRKEEERISKLISITKPINLPPLISSPKTEGSPTTTDKTEIINETPVIKEESQNRKSDEYKSTESDHRGRGVKDSTLIEKADSIQPAKTTSIAAQFNEFAIPNHTVKPVKSKKSFQETDTEGEPKRNVDQGKPRSSKEVRNDQTVMTVNSEKKACEKDATKNISEVAKKKKCYTAPTQWEDANDPNFANWMPPQDQSGDGRTKLNDKYGY